MTCCSWTVTMSVLGHICVRRSDNKQPWVWYSRKRPPMIKMLNQNMIRRGTQKTGLGVIISRCSPDRQHERSDSLPGNVACSFFWYTVDEWRNYFTSRVVNTKHGLGKKANLHYTTVLGANLPKEDIGKELLTSGKNVLVFRQLAGQVRTIIKEGWFSDLEILEYTRK